MRAIIQDAYGPRAEDVLRLGEVDKPTIGSGEVLVRVHASSVDRGTWHVMAGLPYPMRLAGFGVRRPKHHNPGRNFAGTIEAVDSTAKAFKPGDEVFGVCAGSFAEYIAVRTDKIAPKPSTISFAEAAVVPISALTALQAVRDRGKVKPGHQVLIIGASGGVGTFAVQIAKAYGAEVTAVCSTSKVDLVRGLGAGRVIDYTTEDFADGTHRYDVILDIGGTPRLSRLRRALAPAGTLVIVGGEGEGRLLGGIDRQIRATLLSLFVKQKLGTFISSENAEDLVVLGGLIDAGKVKPVVDRTYPLSEVASAIAYLVDGSARGKVAIAVQERDAG